MLAKLIPALSEECDFAVKAEIGDSNGQSVSNPTRDLLTLSRLA